MKKVVFKFAGSLKKSILFSLLFLLSPDSLQAQTLPYWNGHVAFAEGRYDDAVLAYQAAIDKGSKWDWLPELIETVKTRKALGSIHPPSTHHIGIIFITSLHEVSDNKTTVSANVTPSQKRTWLVNFNVLKKTIESLSKGEWTIEFDSINAISTYRKDSGLAPDNPDQLNLEGTFFETMDKFDSYITLSNTTSPALGLARRYPYINGVLYGPHRGMVLLNAGNHGYDVLLHEFFHIVEWVSGTIDPAHGFEKNIRQSFPGWTGTTEFDYYRWHFSNTLPKIGWSRLNHRTRWIPIERNQSNFKLISDAYAAIPFPQRQQANTLANEAAELKGKDLKGAVAKWEEAIKLSPYQLPALIELQDYYRFTVKDDIKTEQTRAKLKLARRMNEFYAIDTVTRELGAVAAQWHKEDITESWKFNEWDLGNTIKESGCNRVTFYFTNGWKAVNIDSVSILKDGVRVALDAHVGFSGTKKANHVYQLMVPSFDPASTYKLRAKLKGVDGVDSYGRIHLKPVEVAGCRN